MLTSPAFSVVARTLGTLPQDLEARVHERFRALAGSVGTCARWPTPSSHSRTGSKVERPRFERTALTGAKWP